MRLPSFLAFWYRNALVTAHSFPDMFTMLFWPLTSLLAMGLFATFIADPRVMTIVLVGSIGWSYAYASQVDTSYTFVREIWYRSIKKLRLLPISNAALVLSNWSYGLFRTTVVFCICTVIAWVLFGFNTLATNIAFLIAIMFGVSLFGLVMGLFVCCGVLKFGQRAEVLTWSIVDALILVSGVFYPVAVLPTPAQSIALLSPLTYAFETLRDLYINGVLNWGYLARLYIFDAVYIAVLWAAFIALERRARQTGFFQKYE